MSNPTSEIVNLLAPLSSPFFALLVCLTIGPLTRFIKRARLLTIALLLETIVFVFCYQSASIVPEIKALLEGLNSPFFLVFTLIILPAMLLPRNRNYKLFLVFPAIFVAMGVWDIFNSYQQIPENERGFYWFLISPMFLVAMVASLLVIIQSLLSMKWFRRIVRLTCLLVLLYGGFALRSSYVEYKEMLSHRSDVQKDFMLITSTFPAMKDGEKLVYLPAAPCRFSKDGGYVQGCNIELLQRIMQLDHRSLLSGEPEAVNTLGLLLAALLTFFFFCFFFARIACGWLCPLSTLGDILNKLRALLGFPYMKPSKTVKITALASGATIASAMLIMAKFYPHIDSTEGKFLGCKIPPYPFCKICPAQQVCPVASAGPGGYAGLPTLDWAGGFFRYATITLLVFFLVSFIIGRRLWCRFCPMGMISGFFNRGGMLKLSKNPEKCNSCGVCAEVCPMDIDLVRSEMQDSNVGCFDCVLCLKCVENCPRSSCLSLSIAGQKVTESEFTLDEK